MSIHIDQKLRNIFESDRISKHQVVITFQPDRIESVLDELKDLNIEIPDSDLLVFGIIATRLNEHDLNGLMKIKGIMSIEEDFIVNAISKETTTNQGNSVDESE